MLFIPNDGSVSGTNNNTSISNFECCIYNLITIWYHSDIFYQIFGSSINNEYGFRGYFWTSTNYANHFTKYIHGHWANHPGPPHSLTTWFMDNPHPPEFFKRIDGYTPRGYENFRKRGFCWGNWLLSSITRHFFESICIWPLWKIQTYLLLVAHNYIYSHANLRVWAKLSFLRDILNLQIYSIF